eukprot:SAG11_NODE_17342_length_521_cov_1.007109_1_plen_57_part_10
MSQSSENENQSKPAPEPEVAAQDAPEVKPEEQWWEAVCRDIAAGKKVDSVRATFALQ